MINVIASIKVKAERLSEFIKIFTDNVPAVRRENGCIEYFPAVDIDAGLEAQVMESDAVIILEKWESIEALKTHLKAPHMLAYKEEVKDMVVSVSLKVLKEA